MHRATGTNGNEPPQPPIWPGTSAEGLVLDFNARCLGLVSVLAADPAELRNVPIVESNRALWRQLSAERCQKLARFPFMLVDARFRDRPYWQCVRAGKAPPAPPPDSLNLLPATLRSALMTDTLMNAWQMLGWDTITPQFVFGMTPTVAACIASFAAHEILQIAQHQSHALQLRWSDDQALWNALLESIVHGDDTSLAALQIQCRILMAGEVSHARMAEA